MTEQPVDPSTNVPPSTGHSSLDAVLDLVAGLDDRPLVEHTGVFETAHTELRRPLEQPPGEPDPGRPA